MHGQIADDALRGVLIKESPITGDKKTALRVKRYDFRGYFSKFASNTVVHKGRPLLRTYGRVTP